jgi:hypothetical protein
LLVHSAWSLYIAYPISFEKNLRKGKTWVYVPQRWKGVRKNLVQILTRFVLVICALPFVAIACYYTEKTSWPWILTYTLVGSALAWLVHGYYLRRRFRQQEDSYYHLHDTLRDKLVAEGKDLSPSAFKSLAAYQHQSQLRKADEAGELIRTLTRLARESRRNERQTVPPSPIEIEA